VRRVQLGLLVVATAAVGVAWLRGARADEAPLPPRSVDRVVIRKGEHRLEAWRGDRLLRTFRVAIGSGGAGPKRVEGDGRTPEGRYRVDRRHHSHDFHRFLHVSYPNADDRRAFRDSVRGGTIPRGSRIGGDIGIHGEARGWQGAPHKLVDWTAGCIALDDEEIEELFRAVRPGALVDILP
jgi:murein L,D-transpeptidase YafK